VNSITVSTGSMITCPLKQFGPFRSESICDYGRRPDNRIWTDPAGVFDFNEFSDDDYLNLHRNARIVRREEPPRFYQPQSEFFLCVGDSCG